jgi:hypothetical protein
MDRGECMLILENKVGSHQLAKLAEELKMRADSCERAVEGKWVQLEKESLEKTEKLKEKLKGKRKEKEVKKTTHGLEKNTTAAKSHELYLDDNETMLSMIVE